MGAVAGKGALSEAYLSSTWQGAEGGVAFDADCGLGCISVINVS